MWQAAQALLLLDTVSDQDAEMLPSELRGELGLMGWKEVKPPGSLLLKPPGTC